MVGLWLHFLPFLKDCHLCYFELSQVIQRRFMHMMGIFKHPITTPAKLINQLKCLMKMLYCFLIMTWTESGLRLVVILRRQNWRLPYYLCCQEHRTSIMVKKSACWGSNLIFIYESRLYGLKILHATPRGKNQNTPLRLTSLHSNYNKLIQHLSINTIKNG